MIFMVSDWQNLQNLATPEFLKMLPSMWIYRWDSDFSMPKWQNSWFLHSQLMKCMIFRGWSTKFAIFQHLANKFQFFFSLSHLINHTCKFSCDWLAKFTIFIHGMRNITRCTCLNLILWILKKIIISCKDYDNCIDWKKCWFH